MGENLSKESLQQAIEENRVLVLPARIGQTVYHYHLTCFDGCLFQKRKFWDSFGHETGRCGTLPCHTRFHSIEQKEVSIANIEWLFRTWGKSTFATHEEATAAAREKVNENIATLRGLGFKLDTSGYSAKVSDDWKTYYQQEPIKQYDCNGCKHLNLTEREQQQNKAQSKHHYCTLYKKRVYHKEINKHHNSRLFPCEECSADGNIQFEQRCREQYDSAENAEKNQGRKEKAISTKESGSRKDKRNFQCRSL